MDKEIILRAHHLLCLEGFEGYGYNYDFIENMKYIISVLDKNPEVIIIDGCDDICSKCPEMKNYLCNSKNGGEELVKNMDFNVIKKLGIKSGMSFNYKEINNSVKEIFKTKKDLEGICSVCSWKDICRWYKTRL